MLRWIGREGPRGADTMPTYARYQAYPRHKLQVVPRPPFGQSTEMGNCGCLGWETHGDV
jgi:hypothetical protein